MTETQNEHPEVPVSEADQLRILAAARDYIESWLDGDAARMARCLHPALMKRSISDAADVIETLTRDDMIDATASGRGTRYQRTYEVSILDAFGDIATVRVFSATYMDYLHVVRFGERWLLLNVLWQRRPGR